MVRTDIDKKRDEIEEWLKNGVPRLEICRRLDCKYDTLKRRLEKWGLDHLKNQGRKGYTAPNRLSALEYISSSTCIRTHKARKKLIEDGIFEAKCSVCGIEKWNEEPAPLELDHIDGNRYNWELSNLRIICPNCHAQTDTNSGKNIGAYN